MLSVRNLAVRLILWLCARYNIVLLDELRQPHGSDAKQRAVRWQAFALEEGGLFDMIEESRRSLFHAYTDVQPSDIETKDNLAMQDRCWQQLRVQVDSVIATGQIQAQPKPATISPIRKSVGQV